MAAIQNIGRVFLNGIRRHLKLIVFAFILWSGYKMISLTYNHVKHINVKYAANNNQKVADKHPMANSRKYSGGNLENSELKHADNQFQSDRNFCTKPMQYVNYIKCDRILSGDEQYMTYIKNLTKFKTKRSPGNCNLSSFSANCSAFISDHGYRDKPVTAEELDFPLAFGLKVHKRPYQVEQLLRTIYRPHNVYCIHVDVKAEENVFQILRDVAKCFDNVYVIRKYRVVYSSINQSLADIACMETLVNTRVHWKYYLIFSGEEFVLKSNLEMVQILKILNGTNDITKHYIVDSVKHRYTYSYKLVNDIMVRTDILKKPFSRNITLYKGSAYGMFAREFVRFVMESSLSKELFEWAKDTYAPEEVIWATLNAQPEAPGGHDVFLSHRSGNFVSRAEIWSWEEVKCHGTFVHKICIFGYEDLFWLVNQPQVAANKFYSYQDQLVLDCLEEWVSQKTLAQTVNLDWAYYRNLPHVKNQRR